MTECTDFLVGRDDWSRCRTRSEPLAELRPGEVLLRVERFALTANNVTYALAGDAMGYWSFFLAEPGWGRIPAMGFGEVLRSRHEGVAEGERCFGFFPMSTHLVVQADSVADDGFSDAAPHRSATAPVYRRYTRVDRDPLHDPTHEDALLLLRGLFMTSFLIDDFLEESGLFGAEQVLVTSASSKTSIALAHRLSRREGAAAIGLTSARNQDFVESLGCWDEVIPYDAIPTLPAGVPSVLVDMAGNGEVVSTVHRHFGDRLGHSCSVGATHWDHAQRDPDLPGPAPELFFAPTQAQKRAAEWGAEGFQQRVGDALKQFLAFSDGWLEVVRSAGPKEVERVYQDTLAGRTRPNEGHVLSLWES